MSIETTLEYIHKTKWLGSKPGLSRTRILLEKMGNPHKKLKFVHVAGTNGKGSTCSFLSSILSQAGLCVGLYTSPYITCFNERMRVDGQNITDRELEEIVDFVKPFADSMTDKPTEFELITACAMEFFARKKCDIVVLEVGMGGELDSTNIIEENECAVICAIGLDHTAFLGNTLSEIAVAKAGIVKKNCPTVVYDCDKDVCRVFEEKCRELDSPLFFADFSKLGNVRYSLDITTFDYGKFKDLKICLAGIYQCYNASLAVKTAEILSQKGYNITEQNIRNGLENAKWQGRFERLGNSPDFILDGAHNPHGIEGAVKSFEQYYPDKKITFVIGAMADKDVREMIKQLIPVSDVFYTVRPDNERAMESKELCALVKESGGRAISCDSVFEGVKKALSHAGTDGVVSAIGSLYFSDEIRKSYLTVTGKEK